MLKGMLATGFGVEQPGQIKICGQDQESGSLSQCGITGDTELRVLILSPRPDWAVLLGLTWEHPALLRAYYQKHALEMPWNTDACVWGALKESRNRALECSEKLWSWSSVMDLCTRRAAPSEEIHLRVSGAACGTRMVTVVRTNCCWCWTRRWWVSSALAFLVEE